MCIVQYVFTISKEDHYQCIISVVCFNLIFTKACFHSEVGRFAVCGELLKEPGVDAQSRGRVCGLPQKTGGQAIVQGGDALILDNPSDHT